MLKLFSDLYKFRELLWVLVYRDLRGRTRASVLGLGWIAIQPLLVTGAFTLLTQSVLHLNLSGETPYPLFVFAGMVIWNYFSASLQAATESLVVHADLLRQVSFPREVLVLYPHISKLLDFGISFVVLVVATALFQRRLTLALIVAPLLLLPVVLFSLGLALIFGPLNVALRDVAKVIPLALGFVIYMSPVLYSLDKIPPEWQIPYLLNPVSGVTESFRQLALNSALPRWEALVEASLVSIIVFAVGLYLFDQFESALADIV